MPEYRHDPLLGRSVIVAPERWGRPDQLNGSPQDPQVVALCPFCAGHEHETPPELAAYYSRQGAAAKLWQVRVVPNKYPAVRTTGLELNPACDRLNSPGLNSPGFGSHEVIIESPEHVASFSQLSDEQAGFTFLAYRDRIRALKSHANLAHAQVFKNARADGGASVEHSHSQLIATSIVPLELQRELAAAGEYRLAHRSCFFCELLARTLDERSRLVAETEHFAAVTPFASRFPYETWVLPRSHRACFEETEPAALEQLARFVQQLVGRLERVLDAPAYNFWIKTAPFELSRHDDYHWHVVLVPRLTRMAGFELATGCFINSVSPEEAARQLRLAAPEAPSSD